MNKPKVLLASMIMALSGLMATAEAQIANILTTTSTGYAPADTLNLSQDTSGQYVNPDDVAELKKMSGNVDFEADSTHRESEEARLAAWKLSQTSYEVHADEVREWKASGIRWVDAVKVPEKTSERNPTAQYLGNILSVTLWIPWFTFITTEASDTITMAKWFNRGVSGISFSDRNWETHTIPISRGSFNYIAYEDTEDKNSNSTSQEWGSSTTDTNLKEVEKRGEYVIWVFNGKNILLSGKLDTYAHCVLTYILENAVELELTEDEIGKIRYEVDEVLCRRLQP